MAKKPKEVITIHKETNQVIDPWSYKLFRVEPDKLLLLDTSRDGMRLRDNMRELRFENAGKHYVFVKVRFDILDEIRPTAEEVEAAQAAAQAQNEKVEE